MFELLYITAGGLFRAGDKIVIAARERARQGNME